MKVIVSHAVVLKALKSVGVLMLHELVGFARQKNRHFLFFESLESIELIGATFSHPTDVIYKELLHQSVRNALAYPSSRATIKIDDVGISRWDGGVPILTLADGLKVLGEKLSILLENSTNDWNFLLGIMSPMDRKLIQEYVDDGWAEPLHGGGDTLGALLDARLLKPWLCLRTFVLFDSDRLHPSELSPEWTTCREGRRPISCRAFEWEAKAKLHMTNRYWMLRRRFIESYMPKEEVKIGAEKKIPQAAIDVYFSMKADARWYYNMKNGLVKDAKRDDCERIGNLYDELSEDERLLLANGFGGTLAKHYEKAIEKEFAWDADARAEADVALPKLLQLL